MRNFKYAIMAFAVLAMGLTSCSNDNDDSDAKLSGKKAKLNINITNPAGTRATGTAPSTDNTVNNFMVFVIDQTGNIGWQTFVSSGSTLADYAVSTTATDVYIVANAGDLTSKNFTTKNELLAYKEDLSTMYTARWATGNTGISFSQDASGNYEANATIALKFIAARITVEVENTMNGYDGTTANTVIINDVVLMNVRGESLLFGSSLIPSAYSTDKKFYEGMANPVTGSFTNYPVAGEFTVDATNLKDAYTFTSGTNSTYYYYAYENNATTATALPTIVTLVGTDTDGDPVYFPVHLASYEQWEAGSGSVASVTRGNSYNIKIKLTGDATKGNGGGTTDPTDPVVSSTVNISISINDWTPVALEKEF